MTNNKEMGVLIDLEDQNDKSLYEDAYKEIEYIDSTSEKFEFNVTNKTQTAPTKSKSNGTAKQTSDKGHCIRCDKAIKLNPLVPYCKDCYNIWKKYEDEEYQENYCHICGSEQSSSMLKPTCYSCYKANKNKLEFNL